VSIFRHEMKRPIFGRRLPLATLPDRTMNRIFLTLCGLSTVVLVAAFVLGMQIDDPRVLDRSVQTGVQHHVLAGLAGLCAATLVHALVLTYFMGTGRWLEETSQAYRLPADFYNEAKATKYRLLPAMMGCFALLLTTGALGAAVDPASPVQFDGGLGLSAAAWHRGSAMVTLAANLAVNYWEYLALFRNGEIVQAVLAEVRRIRLEKGLAVD
jgi:hypothetical protein